MEFSISTMVFPIIENLDPDVYIVGIWVYMLAEKLIYI